MPTANASRRLASRPDFRHVEAWIFDLDNTLYPAATGIFAQIDARMTDYVQKLLGVEADEARRIQKAYYRDHGTTLNGLMIRHGVDPEDFLAHVHAIDLSAIVADAALVRAIAALPGRHFVFTNGCRNHAARVLERAGLARAMDAVWDIRTIAFRPKPATAAYEAVIAEAGIAPDRAAMFEDIARNLVPAHKLGMTTVWLNADSPWARHGPQAPDDTAAHVDYETGDLALFLQTIRTANHA